MSKRAARLFARLQEARFYRDLHREAANLLRDGAGKTWLDVGCGPGVLTRIAADDGYRASGIDRDPDMIAAARRLADQRQRAATFEVADIAAAIAKGLEYDVVSASSLLVVVPDPEAELRQLLTLAKPGGAVLIIEATNRMTRMRAFRQLVTGSLGDGGLMLLVWAMARSGRALPEATIDRPELATTSQPLLDGMVRAWVLRRAS